MTDPGMLGIASRSVSMRTRGSIRTTLDAASAAVPPEPPPADNGAGFAQVVQSAIVSRLGVTDRGTKSRSFAVVRHTRCPAILVEGGFVNNPAESHKLREPAYREKLAGAIADGIAMYFQKTTMDAEAAKTR